MSLTFASKKQTTAKGPQEKRKRLMQHKTEAHIFKKRRARTEDTVPSRHVPTYIQSNNVPWIKIGTSTSVLKLVKGWMATNHPERKSFVMLN